MWYPVDIYKGDEAPYAESCPYCTGKRRAADKTGVPTEYFDADISKFDFSVYREGDMTDFRKVCYSFVNDFDDWKDKRRGLYLWSEESGTGKTFLACCLARSVMIKHNISMRYVTTTDYMQLMKDSNGRERGENDPTQTFRECGLLVLDDFGLERGTDWTRNEVSRLINDRTRKGLLTIYVSSRDLNDITGINKEIKNRMRDAVYCIELPEESIRERKSEEKAEEFLQEILHKS